MLTEPQLPNLLGARGSRPYLAGLYGMPTRPGLEESLLTSLGAPKGQGLLESVPYPFSMFAYSIQWTPTPRMRTQWPQNV